VNGLACGVIFLGVGQLLARSQVKPHFEPAATLLGWSLVLVAVAGGIWTGSEASAWLHRVALLGLGVALARRSWTADSFWLLVMGVVAAYVAFLAITLEWVGAGAVSALYVAVSAVGLLVLLLRLRARRRKPAS
jgi:hypothetical protein